MSLPEIIREYGEAFRGDWSPSTIDGRTVRRQMDQISVWIETPETYPGDSGARDILGICANGAGHWEDHCDDDVACPGRPSQGTDAHPRAPQPRNRGA